MNERTRLLTMILLAAAPLTLWGCSGGNSGDSGGGDTGSTVTSAEEEVPIPTAEQADAEAATEITKANADEAFDDLVNEINSDGG